VKRFLIALRFLTIIRVPGDRAVSEEDLGKSMSLFPVVGLLIGLALAGVRSVLIIALPAFLVDILVIAMLTVVTGALHLDGFADTIDGLAGGRDRERSLTIMRDSRIGSFAVAGLILILMLKAAALTGVPEGIKAPVLVVVPVLGRWSTVQLAAWFDYAGEGHGTGLAFTRFAGKREAAVSTLIAAVIAAGIFGLRGVVMFLAVAALTMLVGLFFKGRIGGVTGDIMGAACEVSEVAVLILAILCR